MDSNGKTLKMCSRYHISTDRDCNICGEQFLEDFDAAAAEAALTRLVHSVAWTTECYRCDVDGTTDWDATIDALQARHGIRCDHGDDGDSAVWLEEREDANGDDQIYVSGYLGAWDEDGTQLVEIRVGPIMVGSTE